MAPGVQMFTTPLADADGNGVRDVDQLLGSIGVGHSGVGSSTTNYKASLQEAHDIFTLASSGANGNLIFLSDGQQNAGGSYNVEVSALAGAGIHLRAFGVGTSSSLSDLHAIDPHATVFLTTNELLNIFSGLSGGTVHFTEPGLAGWTIYLDLNNNGQLDGGEPSTVTDVDGQYEFLNAAAGSYVVREVNQSGWTQTFPRPADTVFDVDFNQQATGTIDTHSGSDPTPLAQPTYVTASQTSTMNVVSSAAGLLDQPVRLVGETASTDNGWGGIGHINPQTLTSGFATARWTSTVESVPTNHNVFRDLMIIYNSPSDNEWSVGLWYQSDGQFGIYDANGIHVGGSYVAGVPDDFEILLDLDLDRYDLFINGTHITEGPLAADGHYANLAFFSEARAPGTAPALIVDNVSVQSSLTSHSSNSHVVAIGGNTAKDVNFGNQRTVLVDPPSTPFYVNDSQGVLGTVDLTTGTVSVVGDTGVVLTDIAFDAAGNLYGVSFNNLYQIDPATAATTLIGSHGIPSGNALEFSPNGTLYAASATSTSLYTINPSTGASTSIGDMGFASGGDLTFTGNQLYLSSSTGELVAVSLVNGVSGSVVGLLGTADVYGLDTTNLRQFGASGTRILEVDSSTGFGSVVLDFGGQGLGTAWGATFAPPASGTISGFKWDDVNGNGIRDTDLISGDQPDVVFVVDVSGSTNSDFAGGAVGDVNGDGDLNSILDGELAGFLALNQNLIDRGFGTTGDVSIVVFGSSANHLDMDPVAAGVQSFTTPLADRNGNGVRDVDELLRSIVVGHSGVGTSTDYEASLQESLAVLDGVNAGANGNVVFLSDGKPNNGGSYNDEVATLVNAGTNVRAFGVGTGSDLPDLQIIDPNAAIFTTTNELLSIFQGVSGGTVHFTEPGLAGWTIYLDLNNNGQLDGGEPSTVTDVDGQYEFLNAAAGSYVVREVNQSGWTQTFPRPADTVFDVDFNQQATGTIDTHSGSDPTPLAQPTYVTASQTSTMNVVSSAAGLLNQPVRLVGETASTDNGWGGIGHINPQTLTSGFATARWTSTVESVPTNHNVFRDLMIIYNSPSDNEWSVGLWYQSDGQFGIYDANGIHVGGSYVAGVPDDFEILLDLDLDRYDLFINGTHITEGPLAADGHYANLAFFSEARAPGTAPALIVDNVSVQSSLTSHSSNSHVVAIGGNTAKDVNFGNQRTVLVDPPSTPFYVNDSQGVLGTVDLTTGTVSVVGDTGVVLTDIAFDAAGNLYGVSFNNLYQIDPATAATTLIGSHGIPSGNALEFSPNGTLYAASATSTSLYTINPSTGASTSIGDMGFASGGDLTFTGNQLYLSSSTGELVAVSLVNGVSGSVVGLLGTADVYGLDTTNLRQFGASGTRILEVDSSTGFGSVVLDFGGQGLGTAWGATFAPPASGTISGFKWDDVNGNGIRDTDLISGDQPDVVFVVDVSGSTNSNFAGGAVGDVNGDGDLNSILDGELAGFLALNQNLIDRGFGTTGDVSIVVFGSSANHLDMDPVAAGVQSFTTPLADRNGNGVRDVDELLRSIVVGHSGVGTSTDYEASLQESLAVLDGVNAGANGNVVFLSDGKPNNGGSYNDEVATLVNAGTNVRAFGVGTGSDLPDLQIIDPNAAIFTTTNELLSIFQGVSGGTVHFTEPGLAGWTIYLDLNNNGQLDGGEPSTVTDVDGQYEFLNAAAGSYVVREVNQPGWTQTFPRPADTVFDVDFNHVPTGDIPTQSTSDPVPLSLPTIVIVDAESSGQIVPNSANMNDQPAFLQGSLSTAGRGLAAIAFENPTELTSGFATASWTSAVTATPPANASFDTSISLVDSVDNHLPIALNVKYLSTGQFAVSDVDGTSNVGQFTVNQSDDFELQMDLNQGTYLLFLNGTLLKEGRLAEQGDFYSLSFGSRTFAPGSAAPLVVDNVSIRASSTGPSNGSHMVAVAGNSTFNANFGNIVTPPLTLNLVATSISENNEITQGTVSIPSVTASDLEVTLTSSDASEAIVPTSTTIPAGQSVSAPFVVRGVDDAIVDGTQTVLITATAIGHASGTKTLNITDDDVAGFTLSKTTVTVSEGGATTNDSFTVVLDKAPISNVILHIIAGDAGEATVNPTTLTFTPSTWDTAQIVTVTGVEDDVIDGDQTTTVTISVNDAVSDSAFASLADQVVSVLTTDLIPTDFTIESFLKIAHELNGGPSLDNNDRFGRSATSIGDLNGDGVDDLVVGAHLDSTLGTYRGAVYVLFMNADRTVESSTKITHQLNGGPTLGNHNYFGISVASLGDLNGDGAADIAVGANRDSTGGQFRGAVHVLFLDTDGTVKNSTKIASNTNGGPALNNLDEFGRSVVSMGDLDGDGVNDLAVGAHRDRTGGGTNSNRGAVHILFLNNNGSVKRSAKIAHQLNGGPSVANDDGFGKSVASVGDLDGDGVTDLAVGANGDDTGGNARGAVYVMFLNDDGTAKSFTKIAHNTNGGPDLGDGEGLGSALGAVGDLNRDGLSDLAVGAGGGGGRGAVHLLLLDSNGSVKNSNSITYETNGAPTLSVGDGFGSSIAPMADVNGDGIAELIVGASTDDTGGNKRGAFYILELAGPQVDLEATAFNATRDHILNGQTDVTFTVQNSGTEPAGPFDTHIVWSPNDVVGDEDDVIVAGTTESFASLAAGVALERTISVQLDKTALYAHAVASNDAGLPVGTVSEEISNLFLVIDTANTVVERNEGNNQGQGQGIDSDNITYLPWDHNGDGTVTPIEALQAIQAVNTSTAALDFDGNGVVTPLEALAVLQRIGHKVNHSVVDEAPSLVLSDHSGLGTSELPSGTSAATQMSSAATTFSFPPTTEDRDLFPEEDETDVAQQQMETFESEDILILDSQFSESPDWLSIL